MRRPVLDSLVQEGLDVLVGCAGHNAVPGGDALPSSRAVERVDQEPDLPSHTHGVLLLQDVLNVDTGEKGEAITKLAGNRDLVHRAFLNRMENIEPDLDEILQDVGVVAARVEPPVRAVLPQRATDACIVGLDECAEELGTDKELRLVAQVIACPEPIRPELADAALDVADIEVAQGIVQIARKVPRPTTWL